MKLETIKNRIASRYGRMTIADLLDNTKTVNEIEEIVNEIATEYAKFALLNAAVNVKLEVRSDWSNEWKILDKDVAVAENHEHGGSSKTFYRVSVDSIINTELE